MPMYQVSDLAGARRREFLDEAKRSSASLRDTDGSVLIMLAAQRIAALHEAVAVTTQLFTAEAVLARTATPEPVELGGLAWLAEFDPDDRAEALAEIRNAVVLTVASEDPAPLREALHAWVTTAAVMRDSARRAVHIGSPQDSEFVEVEPPRSRDDD
ncbi:hypothetical protein [Nocardia coubleae]|uniref:Uncharacterized protein n=1 Tax=Nocardia coubleae TaxID=356147 RepID=A0A846WB23_9NOCA|nr:hypothetical protein [Nocardia coubleae]NKX90649.1 hypothetical protein [Nocardia coubleae]